MKDEDWDVILETNLRSVFRLSKACLRGMMKARRGRIITISSIIGATGNPGQANYAATKAGVIGFTKSLAREVGSRGITVEQRPSGSSPLSASELAIWNDPDFKKRFAESYIAETEIEPRVTAVERERMMDVLDHISSDRMDKAVALLEKHRGEVASAVFDFTLANVYFQLGKFNLHSRSLKVFNILNQFVVIIFRKDVC